MARGRRNLNPDVGCYHVGTRGNNKMMIFLDDLDRRIFLNIVETTRLMFGFRIHNYVVMGNHYHLIVSYKEGCCLPVAMKRINQSYARWFNDRYGRRGHVWEDRYWAFVIRNDRHLAAVGYYIEYNPVAAGLCQSPADWRWSSFAHTAGYDCDPVMGAMTFRRGVTERGEEIYKRNAASGWVSSYELEAHEWFLDRKQVGFLKEARVV